MKFICALALGLIIYFVLNCIAALCFSYAFGDVVAPLFGWPRTSFWQSFCLLWSAALFGASAGAAWRVSTS